MMMADIDNKLSRGFSATTEYTVPRKLVRFNKAEYDVNQT